MAKEKITSGEELVKRYNTDERRASFRFQEQCFLMLRFNDIIKINNNSGGSYYKEFCSIISKEPSLYNSELFKATNKTDPDRLFNLTSAQLSLLVPEINNWIYSFKFNYERIIHIHRVSNSKTS